MRQPRIARERKSTARIVEDEDLGLVTELEPIEIVGDVDRANALPDAEVTSTSIGDVPAPVRRRSGVSTMLPEWVPPWATEIVGQPVEGMGGTTDWEFPEWAAEVVADSEGNAPEGFLDYAAQFAPVAAFPPLAVYRQFAGQDPTPQQRTASPLAAAAGAADAGSFGLSDDIVGAVLGDTAAAQYRNEMRATERQNPSSFAGGAAAATAAQMLLPGVSGARQAAPLARGAYAAAEGVGYGLLEGFGRGDAPTFQGRVQEALPAALATGAVGGALGGLAARYARQAAQPVDPYALERLESEAAWHQIGQFGADQSSARQLMAVGGRGQGLPESQLDAQAIRTAEQMRERGLASPYGSYLPMSTDEAQRRARVMRDEAREEVGRVIRDVQDEEVDVTALADALAARAEQFERTPGFRSQASRMREFEREVRGTGMEAEDVLGLGDDVPVAPVRTVRDLQDWKNLLGQREHFPLEQQSTRTGAYTEVRDALQREIERLRPDLADRYRDARQRAALGFQLSDVTAGDARRAGRNRTAGITNYIAGGGAGTMAGIAAMAADAGVGGTSTAALAGMLLANAANNAFRNVEHGVSAGRLERAARRLREQPQRFGQYAERLQAAQQRGPQAFAAALYVAQQNDAAVREAVAEREEDAAIRAASAPQAEQAAEIDAFFADPDAPPDDAAPVTMTDEEIDAFFQ